MTEEKNPEKRITRVKRLTTADKAEAIALWKAGMVTLDDLAKKFKKDRGTFIRLFKEEGAVKGETAAETEKKIAAAVQSTLIDDATVLAERIKQTKEDHLKYANALSKITYTLIVRATQEKREYATLLSEMKALELAARVFKLTRDEKYAVLNINEDDANEDKPLPDLVVQELTAQDIKDLHARSLMADDELGLNEDDLGDGELMIPDSDNDDGDVNERVEVDG